jgi:serine/threonine protein kinase
MALAPGTKLGPYEILAPLGTGGMGEVYRARDTRLERTVAIKILPAHFSCDPVRKQRFEREAKSISNLNHPNICVLYDVGRQDGVDYLVMECVEGETLAKRLGEGGAATRSGREIRSADCLRAGQSASRGDCSPRLEAREHHANAQWCEAARFWISQARRAVG